MWRAREKAIILNELGIGLVALTILKDVSRCRRCPDKRVTVPIILN